jgi:hypothetical protein
MSAVAGSVVYSDEWKNFNGRWVLTQLQMKYLYTAKAVRLALLATVRRDESPFTIYIGILFQVHFFEF